MLFSLLKHYSDTDLKVFQSVYCFTTSISHGVENYFPRLWGTAISDAIFMSADLADIMLSLCGIGVYVNTSPKVQGLETCCFFLKDTLSIEDEKLFKACKSACSSVC